MCCIFGELFFCILSGSSIQQGMEELVISGQPFTGFLLGATFDVGHLHDEDPDYGMIAHGKSADSLFFGGNPIADIRSTRKNLIVMQWEKQISLLGLKDIYAEKRLLICSIRVGNGGLFVFAEWFWTKRLGWFRALGNDILGRSVLLEFEGRKWVITPDEPNKFVEEVRQFIK